jgi:cell filamentation protein
MMAKEYERDQDPPLVDNQNYPGTFVPINKFGLSRFSDQEQLATLERQYVTIALAKARLDPVQGNFDRQHLKDVHKAIFSDVYPWAGEERTYGLQRTRREFGSGKFSRFDDPASFELSYGNLEKVMGDPEKWEGMNKTEFAALLTNSYAVMNKIHPFREGNGRTMRYFLEQMAGKAGFDLNLDQVSAKDWNQAAMRSFDGDNVALNKIFGSSLTPYRQIAFDNFERQAALRVAPELAGAYGAMDVLSQTLTKGNVPEVQFKKLMDIGKSLISTKLAQGLVVSQEMLQKTTLAQITDSYSKPAISTAAPKVGEVKKQDPQTVKPARMMR